MDDQLYCLRTKWTSDLESFEPYRAPFDTEFELLLNLAVGGSLPGRFVDDSIFPASMLVDYVRWVPFWGVVLGFVMRFVLSFILDFALGLDTGFVLSFVVGLRYEFLILGFRFGVRSWDSFLRFVLEGFGF